MPVRACKHWVVLLTGFLTFAQVASDALEHGAHPEAHTEWWYLSGTLTTEAGTLLGLQATWFRLAEGRLIFHGALAQPDTSAFVFTQAVCRVEIDCEPAATDRLAIAVGPHRLRRRDDGVFELVAQIDGSTAALELRPTRPPILHGEGGQVAKGPGPEDAYTHVSMPRMITTGTLTRPDGSVWRLRGAVWYDYEFGRRPIGALLQGWDWFSVSLSDGTDLMLYRLRGHDQERQVGTLADGDHTVVHLAADAFSVTASGSWRSPQSGATYPSGWRIQIPQAQLQLSVEPLLADQELRTAETTGITYWEGLCRYAGTRAGHPVEGLGYVELVGYAGPLTVQAPQ